MYICLNAKYPLLLSDFSKNLHFLDGIFRKNTQISKFTKIHPVGHESFHVDRRRDRQTDMTKIIFAFRNFTKAPNETKGKKHTTLNITCFEMLYSILPHMLITQD